MVIHDTKRHNDNQLQNKVMENKVLSYCEALRYVYMNKKNEKLISIMSNLQTHNHYKLDIQRVD